jgi:DNA adenine methylase
MILRRLGNKAKIASKIVPYFPKHSAYVELFFGAGGMFFNKPLAKHNFLNDLDDDVYNLWDVVKRDKQGLLEWVELLPYNDTLFQKWRKEKETDPILKAVRFLMLSNFSYLGKADCLSFKIDNHKRQLLKSLKAALHYFGNAQVMNEDFRKVLPKISLRHEDKDHEKAFIYADPPYLTTTNNYSDNFTEADTIDLFQTLVDSEIRFALSEFAHPTVLELAKAHNLQTIIIGERRTLGSRNTEILIVNYPIQPTLFG